jgi:succinoglycan biosynthesis transport protein ExoP
MDAAGFIRVIRRWKWMIILLSLTCAGTAAVLTLQIPKTYSVTAVALVNPRQPLNVAGSSDPTQLPTIDQLVETYAGLINTDPVRARLIQDGVPRSQPELTAAINAKRQVNTTLISISIIDTDPAVALAIANDIVPAFNSSLSELQAKASQPDQNARLQALVPWEIPNKAPTAPVGPNIPRSVIIALLGGLVLSLGMAFVFERIDTSIRSEADVTQRLGQTLLGQVAYRSFADLSEGDLHVGSLVEAHATDTLAEQFRALRTNILFSRVRGKMDAMVVTSAAPGEGKTTTASNLAVVMAQAGLRVILVDADFRRPAIHRAFNISSRMGLGNLLLGDVPKEEVIVQSPVENLRIVCSGPAPPNPSELLGSPAMARVLEELKADCDLVIFDSPPVLAVTDAAVLSQLTDGTLLVAEHRGVGMGSIERALKSLTIVGVQVLGIVLNKAKAPDASYYYEYGMGTAEATSGRSRFRLFGRGKAETPAEPQQAKR